MGLIEERCPWCGSGTAIELEAAARDDGQMRCPECSTAVELAPAPTTHREQLAA